MTNERAIQILENLIRINGDIIIGDEDREALEMGIRSLQQEQQEVDLEEITKFSRIKELPDGFDKDWLKYYHIDKEYNSVRFHHLSALEREYIIARHFYELGKNSK